MTVKTEKSERILTPVSAVEGHIIGLQSLRDAESFWNKISSPAWIGDDENYSDRWGASGLRLAHLYSSIGKNDQIDRMLHRFVDDGSRNHARDRTLFLYGKNNLLTGGVKSTAHTFTMITSPEIRDNLFTTSLVHTAMTPYEEKDVEALAYMLLIHMEGMNSPRWGGDEERKRIPHYNFQSGKNRPLLSPFFIGTPMTKADVEDMLLVTTKISQPLDRLEVMVSMAEILLGRYQVTQNEVINQIQTELNKYIESSPLGRDIIHMWQETESEDVFSWLDIYKEAEKIAQLGFIGDVKKTNGSMIEELLEGERVWQLVAQHKTLSESLVPILKSHSVSDSINPAILVQGFQAYGLGFDTEDRKMMSSILLNSLPDAQLREDQLQATVSRILSYVDSLAIFSTYDREYLELDSGSYMAQQLIETRLSHLDNLLTVIHHLPSEQRNRGLLSFYRFGEDKTRILANQNIDWNRPDIINILTHYESISSDIASDFFVYVKNNTV